MKDAYISMKQATQKLGLYSFDNTNVSNELMAYSRTINELNEELLDMLFECFIDTACSYGLENREEIIGNVRNDLTLSKRREMLKLRESINQKSFTLAQIKESLKSFGLSDFEIYEYPSIYTIVVDIVGDFTFAQKAWIRTQIQKIMPAHQKVYAVFNGPTWEQSDSKNNNFSHIDSLDYSWEEIDNLE